MSYQAVEWAIKRVPPSLVSVTARAVLVAFAEAADEHGREAYPSIPTVAWYLGCTERNVSGHVKSLRAAGLLVKSADQSAVAHIPADRRPVVYQLPLHWVRTDEKPEAGRRGRKSIHPDIGVNSSSGRLPDGAKEPSCREENGVKDPAKRGEGSFLNGVKDSTFRGEETFREPSLESPVEPPSEPPTTSARSHDVVEVCDRFDEFWSTYPLKKSKGDARKAWRKAVEKVGAQTVIDGALRFAQDPNLPRGENKGFIPYPATWLNGERWEDDPLPPRPSSTASSGRKSMTEDLHQLQAATNRVIAAEMRGATHTPQLALTGAYDANERPF